MSPNTYREYLAQPDVEAELQKGGTGYRIVEKKTHKQYTHWTKRSPYKFDFHNPFRKKNHARIRIYPRFDYFPFRDKRHDILEDFSDVSDWKVTTKDSKVTCSISKGGVITLHNLGSIDSWCRLRIRFPAMVNLSGKRGLGLTIDGDSGDELFVVKISGNAPGFFNQYGQRDYRFNLDFTGKRNLVLGNPVADTRDRVGRNSVNFPISTSLRFWTFDYSKVNTLTIYIGNIKKGAPYKITLNELKALQENGDSRLVNPLISVNNKAISFPVTLSIKQGAPYMIEYDGNTGKYQIFDSDYNFLSKGVRAAIDFRKGNNILTITSDLSDYKNSSRAMIDVSIYADLNMDVGEGNTQDANVSDDYPQHFFPILYNSIL